jgi:hypothetical protein
MYRPWSTRVQPLIATHCCCCHPQARLTVAPHPLHSSPPRHATLGACAPICLHHTQDARPDRPHCTLRTILAIKLVTAPLLCTQRSTHAARMSCAVLMCRTHTTPIGLPRMPIHTSLHVCLLLTCLHCVCATRHCPCAQCHPCEPT